MREDSFKCEDCNHIYPDRKLTHRDSMYGQYCPTCGNREKCSACGEMVEREGMVWRRGEGFLCEECKCILSQTLSGGEGLNAGFEGGLEI